MRNTAAKLLGYCYAFILWPRFTWWKLFQWTLWNIMKNGLKMTHFTVLVKLKILRESNFYYESVTLKLIEMKRKFSAKRVLWLFFTSFRWLWSKSWTKPFRTSRHCCRRNSSDKTAASLFVIIKKKKDLKLPSAIMTWNAMFRSIILYIFMK